MKKRILLLCLFCMTLGFAYSQEPDPQITNMTKVVICTSEFLCVDVEIRQILKQ